jgi:predicted ribosome quality control (RQC) complex YloA/Tae2 family protein
MVKCDIFKYDGVEYEMLIGEDRFDNWLLLDDSVASDVWFHIEGLPSAHVILKSSGGRVHRKVIKRAAYLCKINSNARRLSRCVVIYTPVSNVIKGSVPGSVVTGFGVKRVST